MLLEEAEDEAFAVLGGHGADADVDAGAAMVDLDLAVLREEAFGDVEVGHDLDAGDEGGVEGAGGRGFELEEAVDAVAEFEGLFEGDQVNVAGAFADGGGDDEVDEVDDGGLVGHHLDVVEVARLDGGALGGVEVLDHLLDGDLATLVDAFDEEVGGGGAFLDFEAGEEADVVDEGAVAGGGGGEFEDVVVDVQRQDAVLADEIGGAA
ncbi:MAG: hypothetical protein M5U12_20080 [Verrucomicrobia bacterium]|nr:hypothetical protein [Verrucomicrobiota bacterium]